MPAIKPTEDLTAKLIEAIRDLLDAQPYLVTIIRSVHSRAIEPKCECGDFEECGTCAHSRALMLVEQLEEGKRL